MRKIEDIILEYIDNFNKDLKLSDTCLGLKIQNDCRIIRNLRKGKRITTGTINNIRKFIIEKGGEDLFAQ